jgi:hypothetical protein
MEGGGRSKWGNIEILTDSYSPNILLSRSDATLEQD